MALLLGRKPIFVRHASVERGAANAKLPPEQCPNDMCRIKQWEFTSRQGRGAGLVDSLHRRPQFMLEDVRLSASRSRTTSEVQPFREDGEHQLERRDADHSGVYVTSREIRAHLPSIQTWEHYEPEVAGC